MKTRLLRFGGALALAASLHAASTNPLPLDPVSPGYPAALADSGLNGTASIEFVVKADGTVSDARVKSADHEAFGQAALAALQKWKFAPATVDGTAVDRKVTIPFNFNAPLVQQLNAKLKRKVFQEVTEPVLSVKEFGKKLKVTKPARPAYPPTARGASGDVEVKFVVAPDGTTINPEIVKAPRREFVAPAILAVAGMTFEPPVKDGKGAYVATTTKVSFAPPQAGRKRGGGAGGGGGDFGGGGFGGGGGGGPPDE